MAIKGKKKPQKKPRTTARPRPVSSGSRAPVSAGPRPPFHRTFEGQLAILIVALTFIGFAMFSVASARQEDGIDAARADVLRTYTEEMKGFLDEVSPSVAEMNGAPFNTQDPNLVEGLSSSAPEWIEALEAAGAKANGVTPPEGLAPTHRVFTQGLMLYSSAAKTYELAPQAEGKLQQRLLDRAADQRSRAGEAIISAIQLLDAERDDAGLGASGLQSPSLLPPVVPTPSPEATEDGDDSGGGKKKKGDG